MAVFCKRGNRRGKAVEKTKALISDGKIVTELAVSKVLDNREKNENKISDWCDILVSL